MSTSSQQPSRPYELLVFGASGFTGERIALYLAELQVAGTYTKKFAVAGRSESKLNAVVQRIRNKLNNSQRIQIDVIGNVSTDDPQSLQSLTKQGHIVITAAGPYRFLGEPVVSACVATKTSYVDVTGEPEFIEKMIVKYDDQAKQAGITLVHACGFDSIPSETGVQWSVEQFKQKFGENAVVSHTEAFFTVRASNGMAGNVGTWQSLVHGLSSTGTLAKIRKQLKAKYAASNTKVTRIGKPVKPKPAYYDDRLQKYVIAFPGADAAIVRNSATQLAINGHTEPQPNFSIYFSVPSALYVVLFTFFGLLLKLMISVSFGKKLLLKYPETFSFGMFQSKGPTQQQIDGTTLEFNFYSRGFRQKPTSDSQKPDLQLHTRIDMPEPGYVFTPIAAVTAALTLLKDQRGAKKVPSGVLTPAAAFIDTDLVAELQKHKQIKYRVMQDGSMQ